jgi:hypothetical protein
MGYLAFYGIIRNFLSPARKGIIGNVGRHSSDRNRLALTAHQLNKLSVFPLQITLFVDVAELRSVAEVFILYWFVRQPPVHTAAAAVQPARK